MIATCTAQPGADRLAATCPIDRPPPPRC